MTLSGSVPGIAMYKEITSLLTNPADTFYDTTTQSSYWYDGTNFYTGDSPQSIQAKANYLHCNGYAGAMMFSLYDLDPAATLFNDVVNDVNGSAPGCTPASTTPPTTTPPTSPPPTHHSADVTSADDTAARWLHRTGVGRDDRVLRRRRGQRGWPQVHRELLVAGRRSGHPPRASTRSGPTTASAVRPRRPPCRRRQRLRPRHRRLRRRRRPRRRPAPRRPGSRTTRTRSVTWLPTRATRTSACRRTRRRSAGSRPRRRRSGSRSASQLRN